LQNNPIPPAANKYGHGANIAFRCLPELARNMQEIVQSGRYKYKTVSEFSRHACLILVKMLQDDEPGVISTSEMDVVIALTQEEQRWEEWLQTVKSASTLITKHLEYGRTQDAKRIYQNLYEVLSNMPDGEMRQEAFLILGKFDHLRQVAPISLRPSEAR
jgi:hypothetical protein